MELRGYLPRDGENLVPLWNTAGVRAGYAPLGRAGLDRFMLRHPDFMPEHTFVLTEKERVCGFVNGCAGGHLPRGGERGYLSCLLLDEAYDGEACTRLLLDALEDSFRKKGKTQAVVTFFNPIRLPWLIPGTPGHQHNNMPGVATDIPLYGRMLASGYRQAATEVAMYLELSRFAYPDGMRVREAAMAREGYRVDWYREGEHQGLDAMVETLHNSVWSAEVPAAGHGGMCLLVGLYGNTVAGFTGPVYPEPTGRGYFAGIGVAPAYEGHGLGTLLFYRLCQAEQASGAAYMSLFTGTDNRARFIYQGAGFQPKRSFAVMSKEL